jgi:acetylornithine deacetylase
MDDVKASLAQLVERTKKTDPWLAVSPPVIEYGDLALEPVVVEQDSTFFAILQDSIAGIMKNSAEAHICPGWCDIRHFYGEAGIPACLFGPGRGQGAHRPDESFETAQLIPHVKVLLEVIRKWCTVDRETWVS